MDEILDKVLPIQSKTPNKKSLLIKSLTSGTRFIFNGVRQSQG